VTSNGAGGEHGAAPPAAQCPGGDDRAGNAKEQQEPNPTAASEWCPGTHPGRIGMSGEEVPRAASPGAEVRAARPVGR
jgi:hypothetical protein